MRMYFASDADKIISAAVSFLQSGQYGRALESLLTVPAKAIYLPDKRIMSGFASCPLDLDDQLRTVRNNLKATRCDMLLTVDDVAKRTGVSRSAIYQAESVDSGASMSLVTLIQLCRFYGMDCR